MVDKDIVGMSWIEIPGGKYTIRKPSQKVSNCQIEIDVEYHEIIAKPADEWSHIAPLRILSFDIECSAQGFPHAEKDPVIQIANVCKVQTEKEPFIKMIFVLKGCSSIPEAEIRDHKSEKEMLQDWQDFMTAVDPDIITGYNIINFDLPYLITRAQNYFKIPGYGKFGRVIGSTSKIKNAVYQSKAMGMRDTKDINMEGRIQLDMLMIMHVEHKLSSYSLNNVSYHFLKEQKEDVHHSIITKLHESNPDTRKRIAVYCLKDAILPLRLMDKLMSLYNYTEMARVTGVPIRFLFTRGQQIKVASQLYRKARTVDVVIPVERAQKGDKFAGAFVLEPNTGFYPMPIATLDFASLYPSIMMAHNLCYTTLVKKELAMKMKPEDVTLTPEGVYFVKPHIRKGLLPQILDELLSARKRAKEDLKKATDPFVKAVLDGRQLALKISANSVYGFTGAQVGQLPCLEISSSVTGFGREMIEKTKSLVEEQYSRKNGYEHDAKVIYGDTDSVMIRFGTTDRKKAMELGKEASKIISDSFIKPIKLEFEKVYHPYLLLSKKRYAGLLWTNPEKYDKLDKKGLESVRRDNCLLVRQVIDNVLNKILIDCNINAAIDYCKHVISELLQNKIDLSYLVITRAISKKMDESEDDPKKKEPAKKGKENTKSSDNTYKSKMAHVELAQRMKQRDGSNAPSIGDRVAYVMVCGTKGTKNYENAEDPLYVLENDLPIDFDYYLHRQLKKPLLRVFEPIIPNPGALFEGEHTKNVYIPKISQKASGLAKFVTVKLQCLGCRVAIEKGALCQNCKKKTSEVFLMKNLELQSLQRDYSDMWTECQRCQGSLIQDVICSNTDCQIFYKRKKIQKDLDKIQEQINRFDNIW